MNIKKITYLGDYRLRAVFTDGKVRIADFKEFLMNAHNPMITKYRNKKLFSQVTLHYGALMWNGGEMEFDPLDVYYGAFDSRAPHRYKQKLH